MKWERNEVGTGIYDRDRIETAGQPRRRTTEGNKAKMRRLSNRNNAGSQSDWKIEIEEKNFTMIIEIHRNIDLHKN